MTLPPLFIATDNLCYDNYILCVCKATDFSLPYAAYRLLFRILDRM